MTTIYASIVTAETVRLGVITYLRRWVPAYVAEVSRQAGLAHCLPDFRSYAPALVTGTPDDQLPLCVVTAPATVGAPVKREDGTVVAPWGVGIGCVASRRTREAAGAVTALYAAAVRAAVLQHPSMDGLSESTEWLGEEHEEIAWDDTRVVMAGKLHFVLDIPALVDTHGGFSTPQPTNGLIDPADGYLFDPAGTYTAETVLIDLDQMEDAP
jgi:hypothetical protein